MPENTEKVAPKSLCFLDLETTGLHPEKHEILEIGCVVTDPTAAEVLAEFSSKVMPLGEVDPQVAAINGFDREAWQREAVPVVDALRQLEELAAPAILVAHNMPFDGGFVDAAVRRFGIGWRGSHRRVCTQTLAWPLVAFGRVKSAGLDALLGYFGLPPRTGAHSALADARYCREIYRALMFQYEKAFV